MFSGTLWLHGRQAQSRRLGRWSAVALLAGGATPAFAHHAMGGQTPQTITQGFLSGLAHPLIEPDHLVFLCVAVLLAFALQGAWRLVAPALFVFGSAIGAALHLGGMPMPLSATLVAASLLIGGLALLREWSGRARILVILGLSGLAHGYAFAESIVGADLVVVNAYLAGLALVQTAWMLAGVMLFTRLQASRKTDWAAVASWTGGLAAMTAGVLMLLPGLV